VLIFGITLHGEFHEENSKSDLCLDPKLLWINRGLGDASFVSMVIISHTSLDIHFQVQFARNPSMGNKMFWNFEEL